jgi:hypothetical protein
MALDHLGPMPRNEHSVGPSEGPFAALEEPVQIPMFSAPERRWECPNCDHVDVTREVEPHSRFHACAGLHGFSAPMVPAGTKAKVEAEEREDYVGSEDVQFDATGRPIMAVRTTREDGEDLVVYAPTAHTAINT